MKKILELNGLRYSRAAIDDYKIRARAKIKTATDEHTLDIYTDDTDKENVEKVLLSRATEKVVSIEIIDWSTKEDDDRVSDFLDEFLKEK